MAVVRGWGSVVGGGRGWDKVMWWGGVGQSGCPSPSHYEYVGWECAASSPTILSRVGAQLLTFMIPSTASSGKFKLPGISGTERSRYCKCFSPSVIPLVTTWYPTEPRPTLGGGPNRSRPAPGGMGHGGPDPIRRGGDAPPNPDGRGQSDGVESGRGLSPSQAGGKGGGGTVEGKI